MSRIVKVSMGLPVYNGERYLAATLDSLLAQTLGDFELVICDNASKDATEEVCRNAAAKDSRVRYIRNATNIGGNRNYQLALSLARGEYFRWVACDDLSAPTLLAECVGVLDREPDVVLAYPKAKFIDAEGNFISDYEDCLHLESSRASDRFYHVTTRLARANAVFGVIRADVLRRAGLTMRNFVSSDLVFLAELALYGKFYEVPERLFHRRIHPEAYGSSVNTNQQAEWCNPGRRTRNSYVAWRHSWEYFRAGFRAPLPPSEKLRVLTHVVRLANWNRRHLADELRNAWRTASPGSNVKS